MREKVNGLEHLLPYIVYSGVTWWSNPDLQQKAVSMVQGEAEELGLSVQGVAASRLAGMEGNQEYFVHARKSG